MTDRDTTRALMRTFAVGRVEDNVRQGLLVQGSGAPGGDVAVNWVQIRLTWLRLIPMPPRATTRS